jgi:uncharacterized protein YbbK (DUF523 family)
LLGELVRYDGKEKRIAWIAETLPGEVEIVSICPEVGAGMPVPRPPIQIVGKPGSLRIVVVDGKVDHTAAMNQFAEAQSDRLSAEPIDGYIFKARSPSCGLRDAPQFASATRDAEVLGLGPGLWAARLLEAWPSLPCVDESEVAEASGQARFLSLVQAHWRARS